MDMRKFEFVRILIMGRWDTHTMLVHHVVTVTKDGTDR